MLQKRRYFGWNRSPLTHRVTSYKKQLITWPNEQEEKKKRESSQNNGFYSLIYYTPYCSLKHFLYPVSWSSDLKNNEKDQVNILTAYGCKIIELLVKLIHIWEIWLSISGNIYELKSKRVPLTLSLAYRKCPNKPPQERIKGTEKACPIHTLFHKQFVSSYF